MSSKQPTKYLGVILYHSLFSGIATIQGYLGIDMRVELYDAVFL